MVTGQHLLFSPVQQVVRRRQICLPECVAIPDRRSQRRTLQQYPKIGDLDQIVGRYIRDKESALRGSLYKPFAGQPAKRFTDGRDADLIQATHGIELEFRSLFKPAENDVLLDSLIDACRHSCLCRALVVLLCGGPSSKPGRGLES